MLLIPIWAAVGTRTISYPFSRSPCSSKGWVSEGWVVLPSETVSTKERALADGWKHFFPVALYSLKWKVCRSIGCWKAAKVPHFPCRHSASVAAVWRWGGDGNEAQRFCASDAVGHASTADARSLEAGQERSLHSRLLGPFLTGSPTGIISLFWLPVSPVAKWKAQTRCFVCVVKVYASAAPGSDFSTGQANLPNNSFRWWKKKTLFIIFYF